MSGLSAKNLFRPSVIAPLLCLVYALVVIALYGDPLALVTIGSDNAPPELIDRAYSPEGYDGQSVYYLAKDGLDAEPYLDVPAYRAQRILLPLAGHLLSFGQPDLIVPALFLVNLMALAIGTAILESMLKEYRLSVWYAAGYAFSCGVFGAARLNTTETLAYALVLGGIVLYRRNQWGWSAIVFALAVLSKEMTLIFPAACGLQGLWQFWQTHGREWLFRSMIFGGIVIAPFIIWQGILYQRYGAFGVGSGGEQATSFELIPLMGVIRIFTEGNLTLFLALIFPLAIFVLLPTFWGFWRAWKDARQSRKARAENLPLSAHMGWTFFTTLLIANALLMLFVPFSTYRELLGILRFIVGLQIAVILYAAEKRQIRVLRYSTLWFMTVFIVIVSDFAARNIPAA